MLAFAVAISGIGADAVPLQPNTKWMVNYQENGCLLSRRFGPEAAPVTLGFEPSVVAAAEGRLVVLVPDPDKRAAATGKASIKLAPSGEVLTANFNAGPIGTERGLVLWLAADKLVSLTGAVTMTLAAGDEAPVTLQTNGMTKALDAIRSCQDDLVKTWGVDRADMVKVEDQPAPASFISYDAYPRSAILSKAQGRVISLLTVGDDGRVTGCRVVGTSGHSELDTITCKLARKARFGKTKRDPNQAPRWMPLQVRWVLPEK